MNALLDALFTSTTATGLLARCRFPEDGPLHCAVSGGADSLALLLLARRTERPITVWHVDHRLRENSSVEFQHVKSIADALGVPAESRSIEVTQGSNIEARAREARYSLLPTDILTGHTADDQAETILINLLRGSGTAGLAGMRIDQRPLLGLRREETHALCRELKVQPLSDPMNEQDRFQRVRIRKELVPLLVDISKRDITDVLTRQAGLLRDDDDLLEELAAMIDTSDALALSAAPPALARRAIRQWLAHPTPPDAATIERVLSVARGHAKACDVGGGREVRRSRQRLELRTTSMM